MARINFDDGVESHEEFWSLLAIVGDRDAALGKLVRFFRLAQAAYAKGDPVTEALLAEHGLTCMIAAGWALPVPGGYQVRQPEKHFGWYAQRVSAAQAGGRARAASPRDALGRLQPGSSRDPAGSQPATSRSQPTSSPLALAPAPAQKKEINQGEVLSAKQEWTATLRHYGIDRPISPADEIEIAKALREHGAESVMLAIRGARHEPRFDRFDPGKHVSLARIFGRDAQGNRRVEKFINLGAQNRSDASEEHQAKLEAANAAMDDYFEQLRRKALEQQQAGSAGHGGGP
ncbi:MAG: hypothetical protein ACK52V_12590 [Betaproteobacteria bacterium]|jgi:hypothetical protein